MSRPASEKSPRWRRSLCCRQTVVFVLPKLRPELAPLPAKLHFVRCWRPACRPGLRAAVLMGSNHFIFSFYFNKIKSKNETLLWLKENRN
jgi:hypothetical protein